MSVLVYSEDPDTDSVEMFEAALWSENPTEPPGHLGPETLAVQTAGTTEPHSDLLEAATATVEPELEPLSRVLLGGDRREQQVLVTVGLTPLSVGSTTLLFEMGADPATVVANGDSRKD